MLSLGLSSNPKLTNSLFLNIILIQDKEGKTALHIAAAKGLPHFVRFLANNHASVNVKDIKGRTPLHYCAGDHFLEK